MREMHCWCFTTGERCYMFRNREYKIKDLWEVLLKEYLEQLLHGYGNYCSLTETDEHLQKVLKIKPLKLVEV